MSNRSRPSTPVSRGPKALALLAMLALAGCGMLSPPGLPPMPPMPELPKAPPPTQLTLNLAAAKDLNPTASGQPAPLLVRIYAMTGDGRLLGASPSALLADDTAALGSELLKREELRVLPGQRQTIKQDLTPDTRAIGVLAGYRDTDGVRWRAAAPVTAGTMNTLDLKLGARSLTLAPAP